MKLNRQNKNIAIAVVLVAVIWAAWSFSNKSPDSTGNNNDQQSPSQQNNQNNGGQGNVEDVPNALEGELKVSTDKKRGNLMILLNDSDRIIYLNTSRDFSSLIGKQVTVSIEGSLDDFRLLDITAK